MKRAGPTERSLALLLLPLLLPLPLLFLMVASCRGGSDVPRPSTATPLPPSDAAGALVADASASTEIEEAGVAESSPLAAHSTVMFAPPWVVLGQNVVDTRSGQRVRTLPFGDLVLTGDARHFAQYDGRTLLLGAVTDVSADLAFAVDLDGVWRVTLAANGSSAVMKDRAGNVRLADARARTIAVLAQAPVDAGTDEWPDAKHALSADGRRVTWIDGDAVRVRELDGGSTREVRAGGKAARRSEIAGDTLVALFDDELVVLRLSTGAELARVRHASDFVLADDGKTLAWEDGAAPRQTVVLFDAQRPREGRHVVLEDDPTSKVPRFRGVCGGGRFSIGRAPSRLEGNVLSAQRGCSLIDDVTVDLGSGAVVGMSSATPADDYRDEKRKRAACARARARCPDATPIVWVGARRVLLPDEAGRLAVFDAESGRRVATLIDAAGASPDRDLAVAPDGKTIAAIDGAAFARLWDSSTGKLIWSGPSAVSVSVGVRARR